LIGHLSPKGEHLVFTEIHTRNISVSVHSFSNDWILSVWISVAQSCPATNYKVTNSSFLPLLVLRSTKGITIPKEPNFHLRPERFSW
jgi:hypothetical protein